MIHFIISLGQIALPIFNKILYMSLVGTIIGIAILIINKLFDNKLSAKSKFIIWLIPLVFLIVPINKIQVDEKQTLGLSTAIDRVEITLNNVYEDKPSENFERIEVEKSNNQNLVRYIIPAIWGLGCLIQLSILLMGNIIVKIKIRMSKKCKDYRIKKVLDRCRKKLKIRKRIEIRFQEFNESPCIYGVVSPKILISKELQEKDDKILENIFMHELSHYKRKDVITNYILLIITSIHWFNPFIHYLFRKIRQDMELATDEIALNKMDNEEKKNYGMTLISLLEMCQEPKKTTKILCIADDSKNMERRIRKIKGSKKYRISILIIVNVIVVSFIIPFLVKPINASVVESGNTGENIEIENKNVEVNPIVGTWKPYKAEIDGEEVSLRDIYGSAIIQYGGSLELKEDGTYSEFIGVYSSDDIDNLQGRYQVEDDNILLNSNYGTKKTLTFVGEDNNIIINPMGDYTLVYFIKED